MLKPLSVLLLICLHCFSLSAQEKIRYGIGPEIQFYPAGMIPGVRASYYFGRQQHHAISMRAGMNLTLRHDWGKHDDERGWGGGFSLGYDYYFDVGKGEFMLGARTDLWFMNIDWKQDAQSGETDIIILQPTAEVGYYFNLKIFRIAPTLSFGREINVKTKGEPVGEGWILLLGVVFEWSFQQSAKR